MVTFTVCTVPFRMLKNKIVRKTVANILQISSNYSETVSCKFVFVFVSSGRMFHTL